MKTTTKRAIAALPATLLLAMSLPASPAMAVTPWSQGFESDTDGWLELPGQEAVAGIKRVGSGYAGITSASGANHAVVTGPHMFTRFGGYTAEWDGTWSSAVDVYLDPAWGAGAGFDYSVAANGSNGAHKRDFIIHVAKDADTKHPARRGLEQHRQHTPHGPRDPAPRRDHRGGLVHRATHLPRQRGGAGRRYRSRRPGRPRRVHPDAEQPRGRHRHTRWQPLRLVHGAGRHPAGDRRLAADPPGAGAGPLLQHRLHPRRDHQGRPGTLADGWRIRCRDRHQGR